MMLFAVSIGKILFFKAHAFNLVLNIDQIQKYTTHCVYCYFKAHSSYSKILQHLV